MIWDTYSGLANRRIPYLGLWRRFAEGIGMLNAALEAAIVAQCSLFTAFAILHARQGRAALYFLAATTGLISVMLLGNFAAALSPWFTWTGDANVSLELLLGPSLFLYVRQSRTSSTPVGWQDTLHAVPALMGLLLRVAVTGWVDGFIAVTFSAYLMASVALLMRYSDAYSRAFIWFSGVLISILCFTVVSRVFISINSELVAGFRESLGYPVLLGTVLVVTWVILFTALKWPYALGPSKRIPGYVDRITEEGSFKELKGKLENMLARKRPYLKPDLTLNDLADDLDVPSRRVSQLINWAYGMNFSAYMNQLRVHHAANWLAQTSGDQVSSIKSIMYDAGFRSKSAFNREFRRVYKRSPSDFRDAHVEPEVLSLQSESKST